MTDVEWVMFTAPRFAKHLWKGWKDPLATESRWVLEKWINVKLEKVVVKVCHCWWCWFTGSTSNFQVIQGKGFHTSSPKKHLWISRSSSKNGVVFFSRNLGVPATSTSQLSKTPPASCSLDCQGIRTSQGEKPLEFDSDGSHYRYQMV